MKLKKIFFISAVLATALVQHSFAQDTTSQSKLSLLLNSYYGIKNALVNGEAANASSKAEDFVKNLNAIDAKVITQDNTKALLKDATQISESKDIKHQREHFATLSANMFVLAKAVKLTSEPIYEAYCPMKKAYWLSSEKVIKNPYFGSAMLTCGKVAETIQ